MEKCDVSPSKAEVGIQIVHVSLPAYYFIKCKASSKTLYMYIIKSCLLVCVIVNGHFLIEI